MESPYFRWHGRAPNLESLRPFGSLIHSYIPKQRRLFKLNPTADSGIFLGYSNDFSTYKVYIPSLKRSVWTRNITCNEDVYPGLKDFPADDSPNLENLILPQPINSDGTAKVQTVLPVSHEEAVREDS
ncbi:putative transposable element (T26F17.17) [Puccinia sorghi]|uniref:Putative transposable element (T26F17.17) n=1 Tax=Puccinia sorghi TaxID=27349 RepID=A0A0L6UJL9_9BASI|nr:putative transposable element (T26F17.17) [Puccinia sorghi]